MPGVLVVGSYGAGLTVRVPKAPLAGETVTGSAFTVAHGGKGSNQAVGAARLGAHVLLCTVVGDDQYGADAHDLWRAEGVDASLTRTLTGSTMVGVILVDDQGENRIAIVPGVLDDFAPRSVASLTERLRGIDVMLVGLEIPVRTAHAALGLARARGITTVLNPAPAPAEPLPAEMLGLVDHITPNRTEAATLTGSAPDADPVALAGHPVFGRVPNVVLTLGADGALLREPDGRTELIPAPVVDVVDTTGAGDSFNAAYAVALARGESPSAAAKYAVRAAAFSVTRALPIPSLPYEADL